MRGLLEPAATAVAATLVSTACMCDATAQVFLTYTPGVNGFFAMEALVGVQVARVAVCMVLVYAIVEIEKALVDPVLMVSDIMSMRMKTGCAGAGDACCVGYTAVCVSVCSSMAGQLLALCVLTACQAAHSARNVC
jgi:hypothetical protein